MGEIFVSHRLITEFKLNVSVNNTFRKSHKPLKNRKNLELNVSLDIVEHNKHIIIL